MTKHTFKLSDVTEDTTELARTALGYDWNYLADAETYFSVVPMRLLSECRT